MFNTLCSHLSCSRHSLRSSRHKQTEEQKKQNEDSSLEPRKKRSKRYSSFKNLKNKWNSISGHINTTSTSSLNEAYNINKNTDETTIHKSKKNKRFYNSDFDLKKENEMNTNSSRQRPRTQTPVAPLRIDSTFNYQDHRQRVPLTFKRNSCHQTTTKIQTNTTIFLYEDDYCSFPYCKDIDNNNNNDRNKQDSATTINDYDQDEPSTSNSIPNLNSNSIITTKKDKRSKSLIKFIKNKIFKIGKLKRKQQVSSKHFIVTKILSFYSIFL
jgi:hypothetical protein